MIKNRKPKFKPYIKGVKINYKDDSILLYYLTRFFLLALELADIEDRKEIEKIQKNSKNSLDKY